MFKVPITYTNYNGEEVTETLYFNLNKAELIEMDFAAFGSYKDVLQRMVDAKDVRELAAEVKKIILKAYGEKSLDGKRFVKRDRDGYLLANEFEQSEAYAEFYLKLLSDEEFLAQFVEGIMPAELREQASKAPVPENN